MGGVCAVSPTQRPTGRHPSGADLCQICGASGALMVTEQAQWLFIRSRRRVLCEPCFYVVYARAERYGINIAVTSL